MLKYYSSTLGKGSRGNLVKKWQSFLNSQGYNLSVDGDFGDNTYSATTDWQSKNGLGVDGIVGKNTWEKAGYSPDWKSTGGVGIGSTIGQSAGSILESANKKSETTPAPNIGSAPSSPTLTDDWKLASGAGIGSTIGSILGSANKKSESTPAPVTDTTKWEDTEKGQAALGDYNAVKDKMDGYGDFTYEDYVESDAVKDAGDALKDHIAGKPGDYQSKWQAQLDDLMGKIMNREKFSYNFNEDPLYAQYKDNYIRQGKMAMADTMGQAAAMTGGYGSSWAQSVGQQAYQQSLEDLNDVIPELYAMALDRYTREGQDLLTQYGMVADREDLDYSRYRDLIADYLTERDYLQGRYDTEKNFDYGKYVDDRNMDYTLHADGYQKLLDALGIARDDYYSGADMHYTEQANKNSEAWNQAQWEEAARQYANEEAWRQKEWDENQKRYEESKNSGDSGADMSDIPDEIKQKASEFESNDDLADWAYGLADSGAITEDQADQLISSNMDSNEKYNEKDDGSHVISYSQMVGSTNGWEIVDNGGGNLVGIDANAIVRTPNGEKIRLDNLKEKLMDEGMSSAEAREAIKKLQQNLGISSNWLFGW